MNIRNLVAIENVRYSTLLFGVLSVLTAGLAFGLFTLPGLDFVFPTWFWGLLLTGLPLSGLLTHYTSRRVVHIRAYFAVVGAIVTCLYGGLTWYVLAKHMGWGTRVAFGIFIAGILLVVGLQSYLTTLRSPERSSMPHDDTVGVLDETTGIVDPRRTQRAARRRRAKLDAAKGMARSSLPIVAALSMLLVRSAPASGDLMLTAICASVFAVVYAMGTGQNYGFVAAIRRWEQKRGIVIRVKR